MLQEARRELRYRIPDSSQIETFLTYDGVEQSVELVDVSQRGVRLRVNKSIPKDAVLQLAISTDRMTVNAALVATVTWLQPDHEGWLVGCSLQPEITSEVLDNWALCGVVERRGDRRRPLSFAAEAKTNLASEFQHIQIVNVSVGGFCAVSKESVAKPNDRLLVRMESDRNGVELFQAKVAWVEESDKGGQSFGCNFLTKSDYSKLQAVAESDRIGNPVFRKLLPQIQETRWSLVATGLMLLVVVLQQLYIAQALPR